MVERSLQSFHSKYTWLFERSSNGRKLVQGLGNSSLKRGEKLRYTLHDYYVKNFHTIRPAQVASNHLQELPYTGY